jgi:hypothetical protein
MGFVSSICVTARSESGRPGAVQPPRWHLCTTAAHIAPSRRLLPSTPAHAKPSPLCIFEAVDQPSQRCGGLGAVAGDKGEVKPRRRRPTKRLPL